MVQIPPFPPLPLLLTSMMPSRFLNGRGIGELIADLMDDFLPDFVFQEFSVRCSAKRLRLQNLGLLLEQPI
jgi:hypothetical protein